jgi:hypothetical protein
MLNKVKQNEFLPNFVICPHFNIWHAFLFIRRQIPVVSRLLIVPLQRFSPGYPGITKMPIYTFKYDRRNFHRTTSCQ